MKHLRAWFIRFSGLFTRQRHEQEATEELESHLHLHIDDNLRSGMVPSEARRQAILQLGGLEPTRQAYRERSTLPFLEEALQDLRFALRQLHKNPGFTITAILMLALGIGSCAAIFAYVDGALIRPLPYQDPSRLVTLFETNQTGPRFHLSYLDYLDWKSRNTVFSSLDAYEPANLMLSTPTGAQHADAARVSDGFFRTVGVNPVLGRTFHSGEDLASAPRTVLLSYSAWQTRYAGNPNVIGQAVTLDGIPNTIIGVLPADFHFAPTSPADFWVSIRTSGQCAEERGCHNSFGVARLKEGVALATADAEMKAIAQQLGKQYPDSNSTRGANVEALSTVILGDIQPILLVLLSGAGLLLLIACVNVASLVLVRSESRKREMAVRGALGASPARLVRQFVTEALLLVGCASLLGLSAAYGAMHTLSRLIPAERMSNMPYLQTVGMNLHVIAFTVTISFLLCMILSLTPALRLPASAMQQNLAEGGRGAAGTLWQRLGKNLVVVELTTAMVLLVGAGLLGKSFYRLLHVDTGLQPENLAMLKIAGPAASYTKDEQQVALQRQIVDRLTRLPGVNSIATSSDLPIGDGDGITGISILGQTNTRDSYEVNNRQISPTYFTTLQARLLHGRYFTDTDDATRPRVAIINQTLASHIFVGVNPIGHQIIWGDDIKRPLEIVGIVDDIKEGPLDIATRPAMYVPFKQSPSMDFYAIVRTSQAPQSLLPSLSDAVHQLNPDLATSEAATMTDHIHDSPSAYLHRVSAWLVGGFAAMALILGVVGLYGVIAYSVSQRTREIGVRMALGAQRSTVHQLILKEAGRLIAWGIAIGTLCSLATATLLRSLLFGVRSWDVVTLAAVAFVLATAAFLASYIPAHRAASINPVEALRAE